MDRPLRLVDIEVADDREFGVAAAVVSGVERLQVVELRGGQPPRLLVERRRFADVACGPGLERAVERPSGDRLGVGAGGFERSDLRAFQPVELRGVLNAGDFIASATSASTADRFARMVSPDADACAEEPPSDTLALSASSASS